MRAVLDRWAAAKPQALALVGWRLDEERETRLSWRELSMLVGRMAGALERAGVVAGDVVSFQLPNWWEFVAVYLATVRLGAVADDITGRLPTPSQFDWQRLHVVQLARRALVQPVFGQPCSVAQALGRPGELSLPTDARRVDQESLLRATAAQLAVCRSPLDDRMRRRWQETFRHLEEIAAVCRRHQNATAFVVAPSAPQLDARLCATLRRRAGDRRGSPARCSSGRSTAASRRRPRGGRRGWWERAASPRRPARRWRAPPRCRPS